MKKTAIIVFTLFLFACQNHKKADLDENRYIDQHSYANMHEVVITHLDLFFEIDFASQIIHGVNTIQYRKINPSTTQLILDSKNLKIKSIRQTTDEGFDDIKWRWGQSAEYLGTELIIELPANNEPISISYQTVPGASGLQWLNPAQTAGKKQPFLFTQSQPIHARTWIPLQDSPRVRHTYNATVKVDKNLRAVMSANNGPDKSTDGIYQFSMPQAIPSYLIALGVGDLEHKRISEHVSIYAEQAYLEKAAYEFALTENMMTAGVSLYGEYRWDQYDLLILPPSFPYGGMENPRLSFITPTVLAGDRSLDSLIAHELAHSWSGNLVTNANWRDLWLNEGFTSYFEGRITEIVHGEDRMIMEAAMSYESLKAAMADLPEDEQVLALQIHQQNPDNAFNAVPYDKGRFFLEWIEKTIGRENFDPFIRTYFDDFAFQSINTDDFVRYLKKNLIKKHSDKLSMKHIEQWLYEPGLPDMLFVPVTHKFTDIDAQLSKISEGLLNFSQLPVDKWTTQEWLYFLKALPAEMSFEYLQSLEQEFQFTQSQNNEIAHAWLLISIRNQYHPAFNRLSQYLVSIGRLKLIKPLYKELVKNPNNKSWAKKVYTVARSGYHNMAQKSIDEIFRKADSQKVAD